MSSRSRSQLPTDRSKLKNVALFTEGILDLLAFKLNRDRDEVISLLNQLANVKRGITDNVVRDQEKQIVEKLFQDIGRFSAESFRTHRLPLLRLPEEILEALRQGQSVSNRLKRLSRKMTF